MESREALSSTIIERNLMGRKMEWRLQSRTHVAHDNQAYILAVIGLRTALDRATEVLGIDPAKTFDEKLNELRASVE